MIRVTEPLKPNQTLKGLDRLVKAGSVLACSRQDDHLVAYVRSPDDVAELSALERETCNVQGRNLLARAWELVVPPDLQHNCAPEYKAFRLWQLSGGIAGGALGYMNCRLNLDVINFNFPNDSASAATASFVFGLLAKGASMAGSYLAQKGDTDPRKCFLISGLVNTANVIAQITVLSLVPQAYLPLCSLLMLTGAVAGTVGSSASVNVFNHVARENARGLVQAKNANQDGLADTAGNLAGIGLGVLASMTSANPYLLTAALAGPVLTLASIQSARCLRLEQVSRTAMPAISDTYIDTGSAPQAPRRGMVELLRSVFKRGDKTPSDGIELSQSVEDVVGGDADLLPLFAGQNYLLSLRDGQVRMAFRQETGREDAVRAFVHARLVQRGQDTPLLAALQARLGKREGERALVDLAGRTLAEDFHLVHDLVEKGWHCHPAALGIKPAQGDFHVGQGVDRPALSRQEYLALLQHPDADRLTSLLGLPAEQPAIV